MCVGAVEGAGEMGQVRQQHAGAGGVRGGVVGAVGHTAEEGWGVGKWMWELGMGGWGEKGAWEVRVGIRWVGKGLRRCACGGAAGKLRRVDVGSMPSPSH